MNSSHRFRFWLPIMKMRSVGLICTLTLFLAGVRVEAQPYPDNAEGLRSFLADVAKTKRTGNSVAWKELVKGASIPDHKAWLRRVFGSDESTPLVMAYERELNQLERREESLAELALQETGPLRIDTFASVEDAKEEIRIRAALESMKQRVTVYRAQVPNKDPQFAATKALFFHVDGGFRWMNEISLTALETLPAMLVRVGGSVQQKALVHQVRPVYPEDAKSSGIQGTVRLVVTLDRQGTVEKN